MPFPNYGSSPPKAHFVTYIKKQLTILFCYCEYSRCLYSDISIWTKYTRIVRPELNSTNTVLGVDAERHSVIIILILTVYKLLL